MPDIVDRIIAVRNSQELNQTEFGERMGVTRSVISNIELRRVEPKDLFLKSVCKEYHIDYTWLTTGDGEMYLNDTELLIDELAKDFKFDELDRKIAEAYLKLSHSDRMAIKQFIKNIME